MYLFDVLRTNRTQRIHNKNTLLSMAKKYKKTPIDVVTVNLCLQCSNI